MRLPNAQKTNSNNLFAHRLSLLIYGTKERKAATPAGKVTTEDTMNPNEVKEERMSHWCPGIRVKI